MVTQGPEFDYTPAADPYVQQLLARVSLLEAQLLSEQVSKQIWMDCFLALERSLTTRRTDSPYTISIKAGGTL